MRNMSFINKSSYNYYHGIIINRQTSLLARDNRVRVLGRENLAIGTSTLSYPGLLLVRSKIFIVLEMIGELVTSATR